MAWGWNIIVMTFFVTFSSIVPVTQEQISVCYSSSAMPKYIKYEVNIIQIYSLVQHFLDKTLLLVFTMKVCSFWKSYTRYDSPLEYKGTIAYRNICSSRLYKRCVQS